jgi:hypothetical protein
MKALAESGDDVPVALAGGKNGGNDAPATAAKNLDQLTHLLAHVRANGAGIGEVEFTGGTAGKSVCDKGGLVGPPAINGCLANASMVCHGFNGQLGKAVFRNSFNVLRRMDSVPVHSAGAPESAFCSPASTALSMCRRLLAHDLTLPYNLIGALESNTLSIESKEKSMGSFRIHAGTLLPYIRNLHLKSGA